MAAGEVEISRPALLLTEPTRTLMVAALADGRALPATELARLAGVSLPTASQHLTRLVAGGLLEAERHGRHKYFRVAGTQVVQALESLAALARPAAPARSLRQAREKQGLAFARSCYDHLAGALSVAVTDALLPPPANNASTSDPAAGDVALVDRWHLHPGAVSRFTDLGVDVDRARNTRRPLVRCCLDWTERRHHLGGALGAAVLTVLLDNDLLARVSDSRALRLTPHGATALTERLQITIPTPTSPSR